MNLDPAPRLPKWPFLVGDGVLLAAAFVIFSYAKDPFAPTPLLSAVACVIVAALAGLAPFLTDYAREQDEAARQLHDAMEGQLKRLHAAGESLTRAAAHLKTVEEAAHKTMHAAENLPYRMQEKLAEFNQLLEQAEDEQKETMASELAALRQSESERLSTVAEKIHQATAELTALEKATRAQLTAAGQSLQKLTTALAQLDARLAAASAVKAPPSEPPPAPVGAEAKPDLLPTAEPAVELTSASSLASSPTPLATQGEPPKPRKPRAPKKPKPEESASPEPAEGAPAAAEGGRAIPSAPPEGVASSAPPSESAAPPASDPAPETSASADGATHLLATAYIGIGNKLFIRGEGPGLSWDKGAPMQFISIGKWGWSTPDATAPVRCKLYKNDEAPALGGEITLEPGRHVEISAMF